VLPSHTGAAVKLSDFRGKRVVLLQAVVHPLFRPESSPLVIVTSALALAALFSPLRRHIQTVLTMKEQRATDCDWP
jgi:hypothetical protein